MAMVSRGVLADTAAVVVSQSRHVQSRDIMVTSRCRTKKIERCCESLLDALCNSLLLLCGDLESAGSTSRTTVQRSEVVCEIFGRRNFVSHYHRALGLADSLQGYLEN